MTTPRPLTAAAHRHPCGPLAILVLLASPAGGLAESIFADGFESGDGRHWSRPYDDPVLIDQSAYYSGDAGECSPPGGAPAFDDPFLLIDPTAVAAGVVIDFVVNVHVEPHAQYANATFFARGRADIAEMAAVLAAHGGYLTVQTQTPFTDVLAANSDPLLADLVAGGHEVALHFHEDAHLGPDASSQPLSAWVAVLAAYRGQAETLAGAPVRAVSGGNTYPDALVAHAQAGLDVKMNYKDPASQQSAAAAATLTPFFPAAWGSADALLVGGGDDVLFVPSGLYPLHCGGLEGLDSPLGPPRFDYVARALANSLAAATPDEIQTLGVVFHANGFSATYRSQQIALWDRWLTEVIDPLVTAGVVRYATIASIAERVLAERAPFP